MLKPIDKGHIVGRVNAIIGNLRSNTTLARTAVNFFNGEGINDGPALEADLKAFAQHIANEAEEKERKTRVTTTSPVTYEQIEEFLKDQGWIM